VFIRIKKGLDIPISGAPQQSVHPGTRPLRVAVSGRDYTGLKPRVLVAQGDRVGFGETLFVDKRDPCVKYTAPGTGVVEAVDLGPRRVLERVVIRLEDDRFEDQRFEPLTNEAITCLGRDKIVERLLDSGLWPAFRTRPFSRVPPSDSQPHSIFVTALDTQPLAADPAVVIGPTHTWFGAGQLVLSRLTSGPVWLCTGPGWEVPAAESEAVRQVTFTGPHPSGLPGTHIHHLDPAGMGHTVWHIGYQDVIAIGKLFSAGLISADRVISIAGEPVHRPRLIQTRQGACVDEFSLGEIDQPETCRIVSGSVLGGRAASGGALFLGRYHNQVSVIRQGSGRRLFGWLGLVSPEFTASSGLFRASGHAMEYPFSTARHGRPSAMLPSFLFERVFPFDILPSALFRALLVGDADQAQALGCLELDPEDLALCSFVCPAKCDYGAALHATLDRIQRDL